MKQAFEHFDIYKNEYITVENIIQFLGFMKMKIF